MLETGVSKARGLEEENLGREILARRMKTAAESEEGHERFT